MGGTFSMSAFRAAVVVTVTMLTGNMARAAERLWIKLGDGMCIRFQSSTK